jgi:hypothetical protein
MKHSPAPSPSTFRPRQILAVVVIAVIVGTLVGVGIGIASGWGGTRELTIAALTAAAVWLFATLLGVQTLIFGSGLQVDRLGFGILASSMGRMLAALLVGVVVFFLVKPQGETFWVCFLSAGLAALIAESVWAIRTITSATQPSPAVAHKHGAA